MDHYKIEIFGQISDLDVFDNILFELRDEAEPADRARAFQDFLKESDNEPSFKRYARHGSPFDLLKTYLKAANLGWKEYAADDDGNYYQAVVVSPGDYEEITVDLLKGEPVIELYVLLRAREEGPEALDKLLSTVEKASKYGEDLKLTLEEKLVENYIAGCETGTPTP